MTLEEMEKWIKTAKPKEKIVYYEGHLVEEIAHNFEIKKLGLLFLRAAEKHRLSLVQKKLKGGDHTGPPIYQYMAEII
jgi:hypothetical protein